MKIIDSHIHLYPKPEHHKELNVSKENVDELLEVLSRKLSDNRISEAVLYILDPNLVRSDKWSHTPSNIHVGTVLDIKKQRLAEDMGEAHIRGVRIIKIHPYLQKIRRENYKDIVKISNIAKELNMILTIDCSYGSGMLYETNGVELAAYLKRHVKIPIILAHGGGPKIIDALSLALEYEDVFMDLSFSLPFWWGSTVMQDYAFALKKLNCNRCFYGSDYPYVGFEESLKYFMLLVEEYNMSEEDITKMLSQNFNDFRHGYLT